MSNRYLNYFGTWFPTKEELNIHESEELDESWIDIWMADGFMPDFGKHMGCKRKYPEQHNDTDMPFMFSFFGYVIETCPTTKRLHVHMAFGFKTKRVFTKVLDFFKGHGDLQQMKGSPDEVKKYMEKEGEITWLVGEGIPERGADLDTVRDFIKENKETPFDEIYEEICDRFGMGYGRYRNVWRDYYECVNRNNRRDFKTEVIVLWGPPGTGKTKKAIEDGATMLEFGGKYFAGDWSDTMVLDDFDPADMDRTLFLKLTDRYPMKLRILYGHKEMLIKKLYITSNYDPQHWYGGDKAVSRRLDTVENLL